MLKLGDIMTRDVVTVAMDDTLDEIRAIFEQHRFHHLIVTNHGRVVGVISDRDLLKNVSPFLGRPLMERPQDLNTLNRRAHQIMHRALVTGTEDMAVADAATLALDQDVTCLPVVDDRGRLRGIVTWRDLLRHCRYCEEYHPEEADDLGESDHSADAA